MRSARPGYYYFFFPDKEMNESMQAIQLFSMKRYCDLFFVFFGSVEKAECFARGNKRDRTTGRLHRTNNQSGLKRMEEASLSFDNLIYSPVDKQSGKMNSHGEIILLCL